MTEEQKHGYDGGAPGLSVDRFGGPAFDPSANVKQIFAEVAKNFASEMEHERKHRDVVLSSLEQFQTAMIAANDRRQDDLRAAETRRIDNLSAMKKDYDVQIQNTQTVQLKTTSDLVSTQLDKTTNTLSAQMRESAATQLGLLNTLSDRIGKLEQNRWEGAGKSSVTDPAFTSLLEKIDRLTTEKNTDSGRDRGIGMSIGAVFQLVTTLGAIATIVIGIIAFVSMNKSPQFTFSNPGPEPHWSQPIQPAPHPSHLVYRLSE